MHEFFWFLFGALTYRFLSKLFGISQVTIVFQNLQYDVLRFLAMAVEDVSFIKALKYKAMIDSKLDAEQIKKSKIADDEFFESWKNTCIKNVQLSVPPHVNLPFNNWKEAMRLLSDHYKSCKEKKDIQG